MALKIIDLTNDLNEIKAKFVDPYSREYSLIKFEGVPAKAYFFEEQIGYAYSKKAYVGIFISRFSIKAIRFLSEHERNHYSNRFFLRKAPNEIRNTLLSQLKPEEPLIKKYVIVRKNQIYYVQYPELNFLKVLDVNEAEVSFIILPKEKNNVVTIKKHFPFFSPKNEYSYEEDDIYIESRKKSGDFNFRRSSVKFWNGKPVNARIKE